MSASYCLSTSYAPRASASASGSAVASLRVPPQARSARPGRSTAHTASLGFRCDTDAGAPTKAVTLPVIAAAATATSDRRPILPLLVSSRKMPQMEEWKQKKDFVLQLSLRTGATLLASAVRLRSDRSDSPRLSPEAQERQA